MSTSCQAPATHLATLALRKRCLVGPKRRRHVTAMQSGKLDGATEWIESNLQLGAVTNIKSAGGSSWSSTYIYTTESGPKLFVKTAMGRNPAGMFQGEALGLRAMQATGAIHVPEVFHFGALPSAAGGGALRGGGSFIVMEYLDLSGRCDQAKLGRQVAHMHLAAPQHDHGAQFGFECDNTIGGTPQPNPWEDDWVEFFRKHRLRHQLGLAGNSRLNSLAEPLLQPGALEKFFDGVEVKPSVLHGDLWSGNIASVDGEPCIFDPATYYGHHEAEWGMSWCAGFGASFWAAYHEVIPRAPGFEIRADLYTLYHKLNHLNLFGGGYAGDCERLLTSFRAMAKNQDAVPGLLQPAGQPATAAAAMQAVLEDQQGDDESDWRQSGGALGSGGTSGERGGLSDAAAKQAIREKNRLAQQRFRERQRQKLQETGQQQEALQQQIDELTEDNQRLRRQDIVSTKVLAVRDAMLLTLASLRPAHTQQESQLASPLPQPACVAAHGLAKAIHELPDEAEMCDAALTADSPVQQSSGNLSTVVSTGVEQQEAQQAQQQSERPPPCLAQAKHASSGSMTDAQMPQCMLGEQHRSGTSSQLDGSALREVNSIPPASDAAVLARVDAMTDPEHLAELTASYDAASAAGFDEQSVAHVETVCDRMTQVWWHVGQLKPAYLCYLAHVALPENSGSLPLWREIAEELLPEMDKQSINILRRCWTNYSKRMAKIAVGVSRWVQRLQAYAVQPPSGLVTDANRSLELLEITSHMAAAVNEEYIASMEFVAAQFPATSTLTKALVNYRSAPYLPDLVAIVVQLVALDSERRQAMQGAGQHQAAPFSGLSVEGLASLMFSASNGTAAHPAPQAAPTLPFAPTAEQTHGQSGQHAGGLQVPAAQGSWLQPDAPWGDGGVAAGTTYGGRLDPATMAAKLSAAREKNRLAQQRFRERQREKQKAAGEQYEVLQEQIVEMEDENAQLQRQYRIYEKVLAVRDAMLETFTSLHPTSSSSQQQPRPQQQQPMSVAAQGLADAIEQLPSEGEMEADTPAAAPLRAEQQQQQQQQQQGQQLEVLASEGSQDADFGQMASNSCGSRASFDSLRRVHPLAEQHRSGTSSQLDGSALREVNSIPPASDAAVLARVDAMTDPEHLLDYYRQWQAELSMSYVAASAAGFDEKSVEEVVRVQDRMMQLWWHISQLKPAYLCYLAHAALPENSSSFPLWREIAEEVLPQMDDTRRAILRRSWTNYSKRMAKIAVGVSRWVQRLQAYAVQPPSGLVTNANRALELLEITSHMAAAVNEEYIASMEFVAEQARATTALQKAFMNHASAPFFPDVMTIDYHILALDSQQRQGRAQDVAAEPGLLLGGSDATAMT
ncbi:Protein-ribulosamine 3-kinase [Chlorella vulgaris]